MWAKIISFIMGIIMFLGSLFGFSAPEKGERDTIEYGKDNKSFSIAIEENPTTGYRWNFEIADKGIVKLSDDDFIAPENNGMAGAPGTRVFTFDAAAPGKTTIVFSYERSWEQGAADTLTVTVEVAADMTVTVQAA